MVVPYVSQQESRRRKAPLAEEIRSFQDRTGTGSPFRLRFGPATIPGMSEPARKRRGPITLLCESQRVRLAAAVAALLLAYVASFGPAVSLWHRLGRPDWLGLYLDAPDPVDWIVDWIIEVSPEPLSSRLEDWYYYEYLGWWEGIGR